MIDLDFIYEVFSSPVLSEKIESKAVVEWVRKYSNNFLCAICKEVFKDTVALKDCMHKFCEKCLAKWLNGRHRTCPSCNQRVASRRDFCRDYQFDATKEEFFTFWYNEMISKKDPELIEDIILILSPHPMQAESETLSLATNARSTGI